MAARRENHSRQTFGQPEKKKTNPARITETRQRATPPPPLVRES